MMLGGLLVVDDFTFHEEMGAKSRMSVTTLVMAFQFDLTHN